MSTSAEVQFGEIHTATSKEQKLYTELLQLAKQYPVIVRTCGYRSNPKRLLSISLGDLTVCDLVAPVPQEHVTVTLSKERLDGHGQFVFDLVGIDKSKIIS